MTVDVADKHIGFQFPPPRRHIGSVQHGRQLVIGGTQHLLGQRQFGIVHAKDIDAALRSGTYNDDGEVRFRFFKIILKGHFLLVFQCIIAVEQFRTANFVQFTVFLSEYFFFRQNVFFESRVHFLIDKVDDPSVGIVHQFLTGIHDGHIFDQTAVISHDVQPLASFGQCTPQPYHVKNRQNDHDEKHGKVIFILLEKRGRFHTENRIGGT